jgi:peptide-methionine (R)-S-oxide reductase
VVTRRQFVTGASLALGAAFGLGRVRSDAASEPDGPPGNDGPPGSDGPPVSLADSEWRELLSPEQYAVLRENGTETAFTSELLDEHRPGTFACAGCGLALFSSTTKFDSGTGWPSFWEPIDDAIGTTDDRSHNRIRTEVHCSRCGGHLGHVFEDGPPPTGLRYCINGIALTFEPTVTSTVASTSEVPA